LIGSRTGLVKVACLTHDRNCIDKITNFELNESALHKFKTGLIATKFHKIGPRTFLSDK
jgi:hypothetical protein